MKPNVYIIAGPNGVGKTTFAREFLPHYADCKNFINADLIAQGVSPFSPEAAAFRAGRLMLNEIDRFGSRGIDFGFETTLSGRAHLVPIRRLKTLNYTIHIFFLWVRDVDLSLDRVRERVLRGGHDVPEPTVRRRYQRSIEHFLTNYCLLVDSWTLFDNSAQAPQIVAYEAENKLSIIREIEYQSLIAQYTKT